MNKLSDNLKDFKPANTYKFRFKFKVDQKGVIQDNSQEYQFVLFGNKSSTLKSLDSETLNNSTQFSIESGGYETEEDARKHGMLIKHSALSYGAKFTIGIDVGKDTSNGGMSSYMKYWTFNELGLRIIDDIHGVSIYSENFPTSVGSVDTITLIRNLSADFFVKELSRLAAIVPNLDEKIILAMELLTASIFEKTPRTRFLTLVLAAESIVKTNERPQEVQELIDKLIEITSDALGEINDSTADEEKKKAKKQYRKINTSLGSLRNYSISESLQKQALKYLKEKEYCGKKSDEFILKYYKARCQLVHDGKVEEDKFDINTMAANLEVYLKDLIIALSGI